MSIKKNKNQFIISVLIGLVVFTVTYQFVMNQQEENSKQKEEIAKLKTGIQSPDLEEQDNSTIYVIAKQDITSGEEITKEDIEKSELGVKMGGVFKDEKLVIGRKALQDIKKGKPIVKSFVETLDISEGDEPRLGFRAVCATIAANRMAPFIKEGAYVDIYTANDTIQAKNVRVIKILNPDSKTNKNVLFEIKEEDVGPFIYGMTQDKIIPVQKNMNDKTFYEFSYDPFKYSSYTISSNDLGELDSPDIPPPNNTNSKKTGAKKLKTKLEEYKGSVEIITGNSIKTVDF